MTNCVLHVAQIKDKDKENDHILNKFVTEGYKTSRGKTDINISTNRFRFGSASINDKMNTNPVLRNYDIPQLSVKQSPGFVKDIFKSAFSYKPNSTYTNDDLVKDDNMLQVEAHRHFMDYGSDYLALEMGLVMHSNIQMTVVDNTSWQYCYKRDAT